MAETTQQQSEYVYLECVSDGKKLRVRIISPGYHNDANCQFPREIRQDGRKFRVPPSAVKFALGSAGKYFYRVTKKSIEIVDDSDRSITVALERVFEEEDPDCLVCYGQPHDVVLVPCGHYCLCESCAKTIQSSTRKCPMCRGNINMIVKRDQISIG